MTLFGPDGSHHQDGMTVGADWAKVDFLIWRASIGRRVDRTYATWRDNAKLHDKPFCAYHFVYPTGSYPATQQADTFALAEPDKSVPVMLDWEHDGSLVPTFGDVEKVCDAIRALGYKVPLMYTGRWYWAQQGQPTISGCGFELVNSNYGNQQPTGQYGIVSRYLELGGNDSFRWDVSYGGLSPVVWQYGSRIAWGDRYMDMNAVVDHSVIERAFHDWSPPKPEPAPLPPKPNPEEIEMTQEEMDQLVERISDETTKKVFSKLFNTRSGKLAYGTMMNYMYSGVGQIHDAVTDDS